MILASNSKFKKYIENDQVKIRSFKASLASDSGLFATPLQKL